MRPTRTMALCALLLGLAPSARAQHRSEPEGEARFACVDLPAPRRPIAYLPRRRCGTVELASRAGVGPVRGSEPAPRIDVIAASSLTVRLPWPVYTRFALEPSHFWYRGAGDRNVTLLHATAGLDTRYGGLGFGVARMTSFDGDGPFAQIAFRGLLVEGRLGAVDGLAASFVLVRLPSKELTSIALRLDMPAFPAQTGWRSGGAWLEISARGALGIELGIWHRVKELPNGGDLALTYAFNSHWDFHTSDFLWISRVLSFGVRIRSGRRLRATSIGP